MPTPEPQQPQRKSSIVRISIIYGTILVVVLGVAAGLLVLLHSNDGNDTPSPPPPSSAPPVGNFSFTVREVKAVPTGETAGVKQQANTAAKSIERTMDSLYFTGYLNPSAWQSGNYDDAWKLFTEQARGQARKDEPTLTLGSDAGSKYSAVGEGPNTAFVKVLMDPAGHAATAVVTVKFTAKGTGKDGATSLITSSGEYFLIPGGGGWKITGYDVKQRAA